MNMTGINSIQVGAKNYTFPPSTSVIAWTNSLQGYSLSLGQCSNGQFLKWQSSNSTWLCGSLPSGSITLLSNDETDSTQTITSTDTTIKSYSLASNTCSQVMVESESELTSGVLSLAQTVNLKVFDGATLKKTFTARSLALSVGKSSIEVKTAFVEQASKTLSITEGATGLDTGSSVVLHSMRVYCIS